jgi:hypothetical protein
MRFRRKVTLPSSGLNSKPHTELAKKIFFCLSYKPEAEGRSGVASERGELTKLYDIIVYTPIHLKSHDTGCGKLTSFFIWHFIFKKGS